MTPTSTTELRQLLDFTVGLAREAGEITLRYFRQSVTVAQKPDGSFVTAADLEAERHIRESIDQTFPDDGILGEEEEERAGKSGRRWIIDPLDGTLSFVHGVPLYGVMIGLEIDNDPALGVVNLPAINEIVYAGRELGCFVNGEPARVSTTSSLDKALLLATDFGACDKFGFGPAATALQAAVTERRTWGDCYGHILVATGRADVMLDPVMKAWDCAALLPILAEAGGTFTDWQGQPTIHGGNAISTNGVLFKEVMETIRKVA